MFWNKANNDNPDVYLETSACQRNTYRLMNPPNTWVKITGEDHPINDLSTSGFSFEDESINEHEKIRFTLRLSNNILIDAEAEVLHKQENNCGCCFTQITYPDKEVINIFILESLNQNI